MLRKLLIELGILNEKNQYEYGCVMLYSDFPSEIIKLQDAINPNDLYTASDNGGYGLETEAHCTLLYGLHDDVKLDEVKNIIDGCKFGDLRATGPSLFENEKFDVLKYDVTYPTRGGAFLHKCNKQLATLPNTQTFPDYHPHMTIAYLKPGMGQKYVEMFKKYKMDKFDIKSNYVVYSESNGIKTKIKI